MIKSITVTNPKGESLELDLFHPEKSGLIVKSITGLGPPKANINSTDLATADGALYSSARPAPVILSSIYSSGLHRRLKMFDRKPISTFL